MGVGVLFIPSKIQANFNTTRSEEAESAPPAVNQPQENQKGPKHPKVYLFLYMGFTNSTLPS